MKSEQKDAILRGWLDPYHLLVDDHSGLAFTPAE